MDREALKRKAAQRAVEFVESGMLLGLGTGSTARHVLDVLAEKLKAGSLRDIAGVPTSAWTASYARNVGIPLIDLDDAGRLDLALDGADEVDPNLDLIKGLGGALLREKIVESVAARFVVVVDESKLVTRLGSRGPVPVEVVPFGWRTQLERFVRAGAEPRLRLVNEDTPFRTDEGNFIVDCTFENGIEDAALTERALRTHPGVVETGLFIGMASTVVVAGAEEQVLERGSA